MAHQFKPGDRVRLKAEYRHLAYGAALKSGEPQVIDRIESGCAIFGETGIGAFLNRLEPADEPASAPARFKVGDRVRLKVSEKAHADCYGLHGDLVITEINTGGEYAGFAGHIYVANFDRLELVELAPPAPALIDAARTYRTRDGRAVRIYATDGGGDYPVHGAIEREDGTLAVRIWTATGATFGDGTEDEDDLIEVKPERSGWVNVYHRSNGYFSPGPSYETQAEASAAAVQAGGKRIACIHLKFREGDGL
jgi:hypothetical protein